MTKLGCLFVPLKRGRQIFGDADTIFEHPGEIIHCTSMAAIGGIKIVLYRLQSFAPQGKRSAQQEHKNRIS